MISWDWSTRFQSHELLEGTEASEKGFDHVLKSHLYKDDDNPNSQTESYPIGPSRGSTLQKTSRIAHPIATDEDSAQIIYCSTSSSSSPLGMIEQKTDATSLWVPRKPFTTLDTYDWNVDASLSNEHCAHCLVLSFLLFFDCTEARVFGCSG